MSEEQVKQSSVPMLDAYLAQKSQLLRKQLYSIETVEEQCNPLISINEEQAIKEHLTRIKQSNFR
jgi:uncharacterized protein YbaP (TraB family)